LNTRLEENQKAERELYARKMSAHEQYEGARKKLARFEDAASQRVCELCGQEITGEHAHQEKVRLQQQVEDYRSACEEQKRLHQETVNVQQHLADEIAALGRHITDVGNKCRQYEDRLRDRQNEAEHHSRQLLSAFSNMQASFRKQIIDVVPVEDTGWLETIYPTETDLQTLQEEVRGKAALEREGKRLRKEKEGWLHLQGQKMLANEQRSHLLESLDIAEAMSSREEKECIDRELENIETKISQQRRSYQQADSLLQQASETCEQLQGEEQDQRIKLAAEQAGQEATGRTLRSLIAALPPDWQEKAASILVEEVKQLEQKRDLLAPYELQYEQFGHARRDKAACEQRINELQEQIATYPAEASRSAREVEQELNQKKEERRIADNERNGARHRLAQLREQWRQRVDLEQQKREAERFRHLYKLLSDLLGRDGLQLYLLQEAENVITELANETLSGLSHGRMRLELRRDSKAGSTSNEALDLLVYDRDTLQRPIPIDHVSGSQKFRIAVSLALAIGRYSNLAAHPIESVIIDEGFGSLDKNGRDDMIQELNTLSQQLACIILVSHQDDFAAAFPNRYSFKLVDRASCVTLVGED
jgi:DNA repair protein SbcC/Rad50